MGQAGVAETWANALEGVSKNQKSKITTNSSNSTTALLVPIFSPSPEYQMGEYRDDVICLIAHRVFGIGGQSPVPEENSERGQKLGSVLIPIELRSEKNYKPAVI